MDKLWPETSREWRYFGIVLPIYTGLFWLGGAPIWFPPFAMGWVLLIGWLGRYLDERLRTGVQRWLGGLALVLFGVGGGVFCYRLLLGDFHWIDPFWASVGPVILWFFGPVLGLDPIRLRQGPTTS